MTRIVTAAYRYKPPPRKRKAVAIAGPAIVRKANPRPTRLGWFRGRIESYSKSARQRRPQAGAIYQALADTPQR